MLLKVISCQCLKSVSKTLTFFLVSSYSTKEEVALRRNGQRYKFTNIPGRTKNTIDVEKHPLNTVGHHEILNESCEPKLTFFKIT